MEKGEGVSSKSPDYLLEKWRLTNTLPEDLLTQGMDMENRAKYQAYLRRWGI